MANEFGYGDKVVRIERPGKTGFVCSAPCRKTGKIRVQWGSRKTWNNPELLKLVSKKTDEVKLWKLT